MVDDNPIASPKMIGAIEIHILIRDSDAAHSSYDPLFLRSILIA